MRREYLDWKNDIVVALNDKMWEADFLPEGWTDTFVPDMKKELADALGSYVDDFTVLQIKEKYGCFRCYWSWSDRDYTADEENDLKVLTKEIDTIISKYEDISEKTCAVCGKPAVKMTTGWVWPVCSEHEHL